MIMDDMTDSETSLAWLWVIEAMASYKEVSLSLLHDLVRAAPELPCGLVSNANERVALRCLEDLFVRQKRMVGNGLPIPGSKIGFGLSESCEDVLQRIVQETSASDLKFGGPELAKWDIEPFVRHKRDNVPKSALEKLSQSILEGTHPHADFLSEKLGLGLVNQDVGVCVSDKNHCSDTSGANLACSDANDTRVGVISDPLIVENSEKQLEGNLQNGDILPSKRGRSDSAAKDGAGEREICDCKDDTNVQNDNFKRAKQSASSDGHVVEQNSVPLCGKGPEENLPERNVSVTVTGLELAGSETGAMEEGSVLEEGCNECTVSKMLSHDDDKKEFRENESECPHNGLSMPQVVTENELNLHLPADGSKGVDESLNEPYGSPSFDTVLKSSNEEPKSRSGDDFQFYGPNSASHGGSGQKVNAAEPKENAEVCREAETSSDSSGYHNEKTEVTNRKNEFLNSQVTMSHDSITDEPSEQNLCMKCNEAGQTLVCGGNNCHLVVHEKCIGSTAIFNDKGKFYCPFCAYSLAITEYLEAKKRSSLSRKGLSAFIQKGPVGHGPEKPIDSLNKKKQCTGGSQDENFVEQNQLEEIGENEGNHVASKINEEHIIADIQKSECEGKRTGINEAKLCASAGGKEGGEEKVVEECPSGRSEGQQYEALGTHVNQGKEDLEMPPEVVNEQDFGAPIKLADEFSIDSDENSDDNDNESTVSNYYVRVRKREVHYNTYPAIPQLRRKKVPWTAEEEQKLKEGVEKFSDGRNVQWKKILEFGDCVFLKGRTTVDLKDKWRNMCKGSPKKK